MAVEAGLRGRHARLLEPAEPRRLAALAPDARVHGLQHGRVDLVGVVRQQREHQPAGAVDVDLNRASVRVEINEVMKNEGLPCA